MNRKQMIDQLRSEGLDVTEWSDEPRAVYEEHSHPAREVRVVITGHITINVGGIVHRLGPGDRLDLAPDESHSAAVGADGCTYLAGTDR